MSNHNEDVRSSATGHVRHMLWTGTTAWRADECERSASHWRARLQLHKLVRCAFGSEDFVTRQNSVAQLVLPFLGSLRLTR